MDGRLGPAPREAGGMENTDLFYKSLRGKKGGGFRTPFPYERSSLLISII